MDTSNPEQSPSPSLPSELIDSIASLLPSPHDLLSLSLTCKSLFSIVSDQLHWRSICISSRDRGILGLLAENRRLAGYVRRLKLVGYYGLGAERRYHKRRIDERAWIVDAGALEAAAAQLVNLVSLELEDAGDFGLFYGLFRCLRERSLGFNELVFYADHLTLDPSVDLDNEALVFHTMGGYKRFEWHSDDHLLKDVFAWISIMLSERCPDLEHLTIDIDSLKTSYWSHPASSPHFWPSRWPHLRSLDLTVVSVSESTASFLDSHPSLERLALRETGELYQKAFTLPPTALPNLQVVWWEFYRNSEALMTLVRPLPDGRRRPLRSLALVTMTSDRMSEQEVFFGSEEVREFCANLAMISTLVELGWQDERLACFRQLAKVGKAVPKLTALTLRLGSWTEANNVKKLADALAAFKSLRTLHFSGEYTTHRDGPSKWTEILSTLARARPALGHVNGWRKEAHGAWKPPAEDETCESCGLLPSRRLADP